MYIKNLSKSRRFLLIALLVTIIAAGCITHVSLIGAAYEPVPPVENDRSTEPAPAEQSLAQKALPVDPEPAALVFEEPDYTPIKELTPEEELPLVAEDHLLGKGRTRPAPEEEPAAEPEEVYYQPEVSVTTAPSYSEPVLNEAPVETPVSAPPPEPAAASGNILVLPSGEALSYSAVLDCVATAYTTEYQSYKLTYSETVARVGAIAVDPSFIDLGSRLYITFPDGSYAYGFATAEDTGSAIVGNIIDLFFDTYDECIEWGRRAVKVYVLN